MYFVLASGVANSRDPRHAIHEFSISGMNSRRITPGVVAHNGHLYAVGGDGAENTIEVSIPNRDRLHLKNLNELKDDSISIATFSYRCIARERIVGSICRGRWTTIQIIKCHLFAYV